MCGFAGIVNWTTQTCIEPEVVRRMSRAIAHRGPDGERTWFNHDGTRPGPQVAMAFRRLAVLDPDPRAMQPIHTADGRFTLVFNGEIYNFRELRDELTRRSAPHPWRTTGDTEVLLRLLECDGPAGLRSVRGMFALALWDQRQQTLLTARDRMGQKPLYVADLGGQLVFGSELTAVLMHPAVPRELDPDWPTFLRYGWRRDSVYRSIRSVDAGRSIEWRAGGSQAQSYWHEPSDTTLPDVAEVRRAVQEAVCEQLVSDVPLGVLLSGGIDSSVVALCARRQGPVKTFSIGFDDARYDESAYAAEVARHIGAEHHSFRVTPRLVEDLPRLVQAFAEPFADSSALPTAYLCREVRRHVTVALGGDGGDELFAGYDRYRAIRLAAALSPLAVLKPIAASLLGGHPKSRLTRAARFVDSLGQPAAKQYAGFLRIFSEPQLRDLLVDPAAATDHDDVCASEFDRWPRLSPVRRAMRCDQQAYLPHDLLTKVDRCSMLYALEVRSPFMDHRVVELSRRLLDRQLMRGGKKRMLREAFAAELPEFVFRRPKMGFAVPVGEWFRGPLREYLGDHLLGGRGFVATHLRRPAVERMLTEHQGGVFDHSRRLYALLVLEIWWKQMQTTPAG